METMTWNLTITHDHELTTNVHTAVSVINKLYISTYHCDKVGTLMGKDVFNDDL